MTTSRIPVAVLGATGAVGQRFIQILHHHPWFEIAALIASRRHRGEVYGEAVHWILSDPMPESIRSMPVLTLDSDWSTPLAFSALTSNVAREVEAQLALSGMAICSNASAYRNEPDVPILIPEINPDHLRLLDAQRANRGWSGCLVTGPNCTTSGIAMALKPLHHAFGVSRVTAVSMQAISGAGFPGVASLDILGNIVPWIDGEEEKIADETRTILGHVDQQGKVPAAIKVSAQANRVPVLDGHLICLSIAFEQPPTLDQARDALREFSGDHRSTRLPSHPQSPIIVRCEPHRPQPRLDRGAHNGMAVSVGRIRPCEVHHLRMVVCVHNTLRGAAGGSVLNGELLVAEGHIKP